MRFIIYEELTQSLTLSLTLCL